MPSPVSRVGRQQWSLEKGAGRGVSCFAELRMALNWGCAVRVPTALATRLKKAEAGKASRGCGPGRLGNQSDSLRGLGWGRVWEEDKRWSWAPVCLVLANTVPAPPLAHRPPAGPLSLARKQTLEGVSHVAATHSCKPARQGLPGESHPVLGRRRGEKGGSGERSPRCAALRSPPVLLAGGSAWGL